MNRTSNEATLPELRRIFLEEGARAAIMFLNSLTSHRFTSLYLFDNELLRSIIFYDREAPDVQSSEDIPIMASYCVFVRDTGALFETAAARSDPRVNNHPKQDTLQSYCGVPLLDLRGEMFGTICHFDFKPGRVGDLDVELLEYMGKLLRDRISRESDVSLIEQIRALPSTTRGSGAIR